MGIEKMKITKRSLIQIILSLIICLNLITMIITTEKSGKHKQNFTIRPNLSDLNTHFQKTVKPYIDHPFVPTEVEKLTEHKTRQGAHDYSMSSAMLVGPKTRSGSEKPTMYSTVINSHPTIIKHQTPQPKGIGVHPAAAAAFAVDPNQTAAMEKIPNGAYSIPVQMNAASDAGKDGYETPNFLHKKETV